jgi:hypothetical protein
MTIVIDKRTYLSALLNAPAGSPPLALLSDSETVARRSAPPILRTRSLRSDYVPSPPSPASGVKPLVTQDIIPLSADPEPGCTSRLNLKIFGQAEPGAYQVTHSLIPSTRTLTTLAYFVGVFPGVTQGFPRAQVRTRRRQTIQVGPSFPPVVRLLMQRH